MSARVEHHVDIAEAGAGVARVSAMIDELVVTGAATGDRGERVDITPFAIRADAGEVLENAAAASVAGATLEVGCASALSTMYICRGRLRRNGAVSAQVIDPKQTSHWKNIGRRSLERAGLIDAVRLHEAPAHWVLPRLASEGLRCGFAFIDGWHMLDFVMVEAFYCDLMLEVGGVVAIHDLWMPGLQHFAAYWCTNRAYEPVTVVDGALSTRPWDGEGARANASAEESAWYARHVAPYERGSVLLLRKREEDARAWDFYRDFVGG